ncbi:hypothetical protein RvY_06339 [Ramazzottius varieornatus]|uniref:G-protein coupled receptors family 1 profile domain-containing protein n=1 Tax=Ramazzottius varieornatus TaxID=947166 RepID=A0A1D1V4L6_RAMVA|nr:hypothetical protein RvY_06339 [Ramazzottius varieornatus]
MCCAAWVIIYLVQLPNHVGWGDLRFSRQFFLCTFANHVHTYAIFYVVVGVLTPLGVCFVCYLCIYRRASVSNLVRSRILQRQLQGTATSPIQAITVEDSDTLCPAPPHSNESQCKKFYDDLVMIQVLFRVLIIYTIMWSPLVILILLHLEDQISPVWYVLVLLTAHGNSAINYLGLFKRAETPIKDDGQQGAGWKMYLCYEGGNCIINLKERARCRKCRYEKCVQDGMSLIRKCNE